MTADAVRQGTYDALVTVLDATSGYPLTREDIIDAIERGTQQAVAEYLETHGLTP